MSKVEMMRGQWHKIENEIKSIWNKHIRGSWWDGTSFPALAVD